MVQIFAALLRFVFLLFPNDPIEVTTQKQLFIEHRFIAASENIRLRMATFCQWMNHVMVKT